MVNFLIYLIPIFLFSCGVREPKKNNTPTTYRYVDDKVENIITWLNDSKSLPGGEDSAPLVTDLNIIKKSGTLRPVWRSNWYPLSEGGTVKSLEKYDTAIGDATKKASTWEAQKTNALNNVKWAGHCNGLAAASIMTDEPKHSVVYNSVTFTVDDVKALLIESWQNSFGKSVGKRCNNQDIRYDSFGRMVDEDCRDVNPASFHILLTNFLGRFQKPILVDVEANHEVWNSPIIHYDILLMKNLSITEATSWLTGQALRQYLWNPDAVLWTYFQTQVTFSDGNKKVYEYILEINDSGNIIGGEWFRESKTNHPDFIWRPVSPNAENPYLDLTIIQEIYSRSLQ